MVKQSWLLHDIVQQRPDIKRPFRGICCEDDAVTVTVTSEQVFFKREYRSHLEVSNWIARLVWLTSNTEFAIEIATHTDLTLEKLTYHTLWEADTQQKPGRRKGGVSALRAIYCSRATCSRHYFHGGRVYFVVRRLTWPDQPFRPSGRRVDVSRVTLGRRCQRHFSCHAGEWSLYVLVFCLKRHSTGLYILSGRNIYIHITFLCIKSVLVRNQLGNDCFRPELRSLRLIT